MGREKNTKDKKKGFWDRLMERLDARMKEKAQASSCCQKGKKENSCCG